MNFAHKMPDWGDKVVGFEQEQQLNDTIKATVTARFHSLAYGNVEIHFGSTVHYGGGVQHVAEGSLVLEAREAQDLAAALAPPVETLTSPSGSFDTAAADSTANSVCGGCWGECERCALDWLRNAHNPDPRDQIIDLVKNMPDPETPAAIPWMRSLKRLAKGIE